ncbi:MAG TPA: hypothetical protein VFY44_07560 [Thermoleophilaceae bacterium]|nr:hypothetical protein [Thermoleophilaceae bacterium]
MSPVTASGRSECQICGCHTSVGACGNCGSSALLALPTPDVVVTMEDALAADLCGRVEAGAPEG